MDIYGAQKNINKLLEYVKGVADNKPYMYEKSKDRLKDLAYTCNQVVAVISEILQDEALTQDSEEFDSCPSYVNTFLDNIEDQLDQLRKFVSTESKSTYSEVSSPKQLIKDYKDCLYRLSQIRSGYYQIDSCARLLWSWFHTRFYEATSDKFHYNMNKFPQWIQSIVVLYGYALHNNKGQIFLGEFNEWINTLMTSDARDKFAVPKDVHQFTQMPSGDYCNLESVVMWDVLYDLGLNRLFGSDEYHLSANMVYNLCEKVDSSFLDDYVQYQTHPEIFNKLGWTKGSDID